MKEKQFFKSCLKPTHIKSFPCWILKQSLIWDDKNNLSWQMAGCCHPLCCWELNGSYINTTKPFLVWKSTWLEGLLPVRQCWRGPKGGSNGRAMQAGGAAGLGWPPRQVGHAPNSPPTQSQGLSTTPTFAFHLCYMHSSVQGRDFLLFSPKDPGKEVPRTVATGKQEGGNAHIGSWNNPAEMIHLSSARILAKATHMSASDFRE